MKDMNLKPCPFCGGTDMLVETYPLGEKYRTGIVCRTCLGGMDTMKSYPTSDEARSKAEEAWNKRAEPSRPHGKWLPEYGDPSARAHYCSVCKFYYTTYPEEMNYCPHCGAKMEQK